MIDLPAICRQFRIPTLPGYGHHHCRPGWLQLHCPLCGPANWTLGWSKDSGGFSCYRCGRLTFWQVVPALLRLSLPQTKQALRPFWSNQPKPPKLPIVPKTRQRESAPPCPAGPLLDPHLAYLSARGFNGPQIASLWGVKGIGHLGGEWAWRLLIPIRNEDYKTVAFTGRAIADVRPKYLTTPDKDWLEEPTSALYGVEQADEETVIIVEGPTGVWRLGPGVVATMGIRWHIPQANRLRKWKRRFILFDPEPAAQKRARELAEYLALFPGSTEVLSGFDSDPGEFSEGLVKEIRKEVGL